MGCPKNELMWKARSHNFSCVENKSYHCFLSEDKTRTKEKCMKPSLISKGYCPTVNDLGHLQWSLCNTTGCPVTAYLSTEVYKYPLCLEGRTTPIASTSEKDRLNGGLVAGISVSVVAICIILIILLLVLWKRKSSHSQDSMTRNEDAIPLIQNTRKDNKAVKKASAALNKQNILIVHGKLGSGVSKTGETVIQRYASQNIGWDSHCINSLDELEAALSEKKIIFVNGGFGIWNAMPYDENKVRDILEKVFQKMQSVGHCKLVLGIRTDLFEKYRTIFKDHNMLKELINLDSLIPGERAELKEHLENTLKRKICDKADCDCKKLDFLHVEKNYDDIATRLKIESLGLHHDLIGPFLHSGDMLQVIVSHFDEMKVENTRLYGCLMYIVAKGKYREGDSTDIDSSITDALQLEVSQTCFEECKSLLLKYTKRTSNLDRVYVQDDTTRTDSFYYVFQHMFLYLCAFHSLFKYHAKEVMQFCNIDAVLQIVRPDTENDNVKFCITADNETIYHFYQHVIIKESGLEDLLEDHPLVKYVAGTRV